MITPLNSEKDDNFKSADANATVEVNLTHEEFLARFKTPYEVLRHHGINRG